MRVQATKSTPTAADDEMEAAFDRAFEFARAAMERPAMLDALPEKATLALRQIDVHGHPIQLAAARAAGSDRWDALISRWALTTDSESFVRSILDDRSILHDQQAMMETFRGTGETREVALDELERRMRTAFAEAMRFDPDTYGR